MKTFTNQQIIDKINAFCDDYETYSDAAHAMGCTNTQLSNCRHNKIPFPSSVLNAIGLEKISVYVERDL